MNMLADILAFQITLTQILAEFIADREGIELQTVLERIYLEKEKNRDDVIDEMYEKFGDLPPDISKSE